VKAQPGLITVTQPDGTQLSVRLIGDEHFHYFLTDDGYPLINDNDVYYYASSTPRRQTPPVADEGSSRRHAQSGG